MEAARQVEDNGRDRAMMRYGNAILAGLVVAAAATATDSQALGQKLENKVAVFAALDKVTARISKLEVPIGSTANFGSLKVTPRQCYSRAPTDPPRTSAFVEVDEVQIEKSENRLFAGWMFAESPGLNGVEHPVFDVWLTGCGEPVASAAARRKGPEVTDEDANAGETRPRRRVRR